MNDQHAWAERRQRMVKCKRHGLHFDPEMSKGCLKCHREDARRVKSSPQLIVLLLSLLGLAIVAFRIFGPVDRQAEMELETYDGATEAADLTVLPLEPLRVRLLEVERTLTIVRIETKDDLETLAKDAALSIATLRILVEEIAPTTLARATSVLKELEDSIDPTTFDSDALATLSSSFGSWRRLYVAPDPSSPAPSVVQPTDVAGIVSYRQAAADLVSILTEAAESRRALTSEPSVDLAFEWRESANELLERVFALQGGLPLRPSADARPRVSVGLQTLDGGFAETRELLSREQIPDSFESALELASNAETAFAEALAYN